MIYKRFFLLIFIVGLLGNHCAHKGLVSETYDEDFYKIPRLLPDEHVETNSTFIVYSDTQARWRLRERFLRTSNWTSWNMLIFPFYELYLLGNGIVGGINWYRRIPDYGGRERRLVRDAVYAEAKRSSAAFILNVGDIVADDGRRPAHWKLFLKENKIEHPMLMEIPYLPVIGNHEHANDFTYGLPNFQAVFDVPRFYTVEFADAILLVLDSNFIIDQDQYLADDLQDELFAKWFVSRDDDETQSWLEHQLSVYDKPFKMVAMHIPPLSFGKHHSDWLNPSFGRNLLEKRRRLLRLFEKHDVQVVISGHDHLYQHSLLQWGKDKRMHFLVGGGGGAELREPADPEAELRFQKHFKNEGFDVALVKQKKMLHYFIVETSSSALLIKVLQVVGKEKPVTRVVEEIRIEAIGES